MAESPDTDEKVESPYPRRKDMDARFLSGCLTIAVLSLIVYAMLAWPVFVFPIHLKAGLAEFGLFGALPTMVLGFVVVRRLGLEGATAFVGGSFAGAINAFLRIDMLMLGKYDETQKMARPDYPEFWAWLVPLAWCLAVLAMVLLNLPRRETLDEGARPSDR